MFCASFLSRSKAHGGAESMNRCPSSLHCTAVGLSESYWGCSLKKLFLQILQYSQENTCVGIFF